MKKLLLAYLVFVAACKHKDLMFQKLPESKTGIHFNNQITESDTINPIDMEFLYNGGGVAIGDFNNDSFPDIYFTASQVSNKLYLNKGNLKFDDVTAASGVTGEGRWCNGASVVDINNDGWQDIYVCASIKKNGSERANLFYINQGLQKDGIPRFKELAKQLNLADTSFSVHAAFFDYDNDGDLDMYLVNTKLAERNATRFDGGTNENISLLNDKLYRNDGAASKGLLPVFTDVSAIAGIKDAGYGLGITVADVNNDGWQDIYVTNDFFSNDLFYINQKNGTFSNRAADCFKHFSRNAMGNDVADINNDGLQDIIAVDMNPEDNFRKKKNMNENNYYSYQNMTQGTVLLQYVRNTLQLNNGLITDSNGQDLPIFGDISYYSGVAETDWSWSSLFADFDNDGYKDLFITNGYPKDITDHDFIFFNSNYAKDVSRKELSSKIPQIKIPNYAYRNSANSLRFENVSARWGLDQPSFSSGAAYVDLDKDGDLDYVVNNTNEPAFVYENQSGKLHPRNFINIQFHGAEQNIYGIGAVAEIFYDHGKKQVAENMPYRGYLSSMEASVHFGLGTSTSIDSIVIKWPGGKEQRLLNPAINKTITVNINDGESTSTINAPVTQTYFSDITDQLGLKIRHLESDYIDFNVQRLLPHKLSEYGPVLAAGDVDGNGLDDLFVGCSLGYEPRFLLQQLDGRFVEKQMAAIEQPGARKPELCGALLFDADGDGDLDLYTASGSNESVEGSSDYQDRFFSNDGKGNFHYEQHALPSNTNSKSCVKAADFDNDGDLDLFVGSRFIPSKYPLPSSSYIFRNDSKGNEIKFTDVTSTVAPGFSNIGLITDAIWTDFNNDGWIDMLLAGEWMPLSFFRNSNGKLEKVETNIHDKVGWWNSLAAGDFDNDGDIDYIAGNLGENSYFKGDSAHPLRIYSGDFAKNGKQVIIPSLYLRDENSRLKEFPAYTRDDIIVPVPALKKKYLTYKSFASAEMKDLFTKDEMQGATILSANYFQSAYVENKGNGKFEMHPLPEFAQFSAINGIIVDDINQDGFLDFVACTNDYGTEVSSGRFDALNGLVLLGNGKENFHSVPFTESGFFIPGNSKALVKLRGAKNKYLLAATQNRSWLKIFERKSSVNLVPLQPGDRSIYITMSSGKKRKQEIYFGSSFASQSSQFVCVDGNAIKVEIVNAMNESREIEK